MSNLADRTSKFRTLAMSVNVTIYLKFTYNFYVQFPISPPKKMCAHTAVQFHTVYTLVYSKRSRGTRIPRSDTTQSDTCLEVGTVTMTILLIQ
jgi:hypothetical protein